MPEAPAAAPEAAADRDPTMKSEGAPDWDVRAIVRAVGSLPSPWPIWPGGWPGEAEAALLDAVFSIRARYGKPDSGVRAVVTRWREHRSQPLDDLNVLASAPPHQLALVLGNDQKASGRPKCHVAHDAARALVAAGVRQAQDAVGAPAVALAAYTSVHGLGGVTGAYLLMLLGVPGVKVDTWVRRFVSGAVGRPVTAADAEALVLAAAQVMQVRPTDLEYAIWAHLRRPRG